MPRKDESHEAVRNALVKDGRSPTTRIGSSMKRRTFMPISES